MGVIVDGTDNFASRYLINDASVLLGKPIVHGVGNGLEIGRRPQLVDPIRDQIVQHATRRGRTQRIGEPIMRHVEKDIMLKVLDQQWREHLGAMDYLRQGIHLRGYAQKDYRYEYKREAFELFAAMLERIKFDTVTLLATLDIQVKSPEQIEREEEERRARLNRALQAQHAEAASLSQLSGPSPEQAQQAPPPGARTGGAPAQAPMPAQQRPVRAAPKVGRNAPCPCGSGKKFKNCHGVLEGVE